MRAGKRWVKFTDGNGGQRVFGNDPSDGGIYYQRVDGSWNPLNVKKHRFTTPEHFITFLEDTYHLAVKGFTPSEHLGGWE
jgi:hypothetical protein